MTDPNDQTALTTIVTSTHTDLAVFAWLDAKFHLSTSEKTRHAYTETIQQFRALLRTQGLDLESDASLVSVVAQAYAGQSRRGKQIAPATYNQRLAVLSSFYAYAHKQGASSPLYLEHNPIERLDRAKVQAYAGAQPLAGDIVADALAAIDQAEQAGKRDYALLSLLLQTGRRAQEVADLRWANVHIHKGRATLTFTHAKGGDTMIDELPAGVTDALLRWLHSYYGRSLGKLAPESPLWVSLARDSSHGQALGYVSINAICKKHLGTSKVHATRHTFAHTMEQIGAPVSEIQARLGHKSLATTGRYLASLKRAENRHGEQLAALYGIE
jgi:integrase